MNNCALLIILLDQFGIVVAAFALGRMIGNIPSGTFVSIQRLSTFLCIYQHLKRIQASRTLANKSQSTN